MTIPAQRTSRAFNDIGELVDVIWPAGVGAKPGYLSHIQYTDNSAAVALANDTSNQSPFGATKDVFTLVAARKYRFRGLISLGTGATTHTTSFGFIASAGLTVTSVRMLVLAHAAADDATAATQSTVLEAIAPAAIHGTSTAVETTLLVEGTIRVNAGGGLQPVIAFGAAPGGTNEAHADSYFEFEDVGPAAETSKGNVA